MFGYSKDNKLLGVMGIQELNDVTLIRHAYTLTNYQGMGIGKSLLQVLIQTQQKLDVYLLEHGRMPLGQFSFMRKFGFICHNKKQTAQLLKKYWEISSKQIKNSVVLEKYVPILTDSQNIVFTAYLMAKTPFL